MRGGYTPSLTLYAKTWDVLSICTSVGAYKSVPRLGGIQLGHGDKVPWSESMWNGGYTPSLTLYAKRANSLGI